MLGPDCFQVARSLLAHFGRVYISGTVSVMDVIPAGGGGAGRESSSLMLAADEDQDRRGVVIYVYYYRCTYVHKSDGRAIPVTRGVAGMGVKTLW